MNALSSSFFILLLAQIILFFALLGWLRSRLAREFGSNLQKPLFELTERLLKTSQEAKEATLEKIHQNFSQTQTRLETTLFQNRSELHAGLQSTTLALEAKFQSLEQQVSLRLQTIGQSVENKLNENLKEGFKHFAKVQEHLQAAELKLASLSVVGQSISDLNQLLKLPHLRGGFGEATLERLLADFLPAGSFEVQYAVTPNSTERVDAVVRLAKHLLPIDSKFPREQVLPLFESQDPLALESARKTLSEWIRSQAKSIAEKYIRPEHGTTDMALLFLPSETLYFEVIRNGKLFESLSKLKVFPVSPNTLAISLHSVTMAMDYYAMARGVEKTIEEIRKARRHFDHFEKKFEDVGKGLRKAQDAYETANTHLSHYGSSVVRLLGETDSLEELTEPSPPVLPSPESKESPWP